MLDFEHQQRVAEAAEQAAKAVAHAAHKDEDMCEFIRGRIRLCDHGFIHSTCGQCCATWLKS